MGRKTEKREKVVTVSILDDISMLLAAPRRQEGLFNLSLLSLIDYNYIVLILIIN